MEALSSGAALYITADRIGGTIKQTELVRLMIILLEWVSPQNPLSPESRLNQESFHKSLLFYLSTNVLLYRN